jgi:hypothetical protein
MLWTILIIILVLALVGGLPHWGYWGANGSPYGYYPAGGLGIIVLILIVLLLVGRV